jgi:hypothetical protein
LIDTVWTTVSLTDGVYTSTPDGSWDLIHVAKPDGRHSVFLTGQASEPVEVPYDKGEVSVVISLAASAFLVSGPIPANAAIFEMLEVQGDEFLLGGLALPLPTFENAEDIVDRLLSAGLLDVDGVVEGLLGDRPRAASERSVQRHFRQATGLTPKDFAQIRRAQEAVRRLLAGDKPADVAAATGYSDQAHMSNSVKRFMGRLPSDVSDIHKL